MPGAGTDHSKPASTLEGPIIILVEPQLAENIGMVARAMANFGLSRLRLVKPRDGWPSGGGLPKGAHQAASGATHVLAGAEHFSDVRAAVADLNAVYATTARERGQMKRVLTPAGALPGIAARIAAGERVGILFGRERIGLENDEVSLAEAIITFPVNPAFASLNLAQAVLLIGYEWFQAAETAAAPFGAEPRSPAAPREMVLSFFDFLENSLDESGFFPPDKRPVMARNLRDIFHRLDMSEQDVRTLRGALTSLILGDRRRKAPPKAPTQT